MWWQDSEPRSEIRVAKDRTHSNSALSKAFDVLAELVESNQTADMPSDKQELTDTKQKYVAEVQRIQVAIAAKDRQFQKRESYFSDQLARARNAQKVTEKQNVRLVEQLAKATTKLSKMIAAHEQSITVHDSTICRLEASLVEQAAKMVELETSGLDAATKLAQSRNAHLEAESQKSQLIESHATATADLEAMVEEQKQLGQTILQLQEQSTQLQNRLQYEAAGRRKAEAALKQAVEIANDDPVLVAVGVRFETAQRIERLSNELKATRRFCVSLQQQAVAKAKQGQKSING